MGPKTASPECGASYDGRMPLDAQAAYLVIQARDARFDGRLFVGVTSTGIYCRPICRVRLPKAQNCRFFGNAASAEREGFRPCLRCRPELAPGLSLMDSSHALAHHAARMLERAAREGLDTTLPAVAARLGITDRHLRRIFTDCHGVAPLDYLTTQRLLLAKHLLTDTRLPVTQVALASGFGSVRRFNAAFAERYRMSPTALRRERPGTARAAHQVALRLSYRPPYDVDGVLHFHALRCIPGVEAVEGRTLRRTLGLQHQGRQVQGWVAVRFDLLRHEVHVDVAPTLAPLLGTVLERVRHALDLDADPAQIDTALAALPGAAGTRTPGTMDGFETAVRIILGQQITVAAARTLVRRLVERFGTPIVTPFAGLDRLFPTAQVLAQASDDSIGQLGIVRQRIGAIKALAGAVCEGRIELVRAAPLEATMAALHALPGIGEWTVQLVAMRALAWPDAFPASDIGVLNALGTRDARLALQRAEAWRPWRAYAVMRLWRTLETTEGAPAGGPRPRPAVAAAPGMLENGS
jgi:AraC family transcriptional regulator of adaptative response / DNA-3-methyladenine glycosylase II